MVFCSECGSENYDDVTFCTSCGERIRVYSELDNNREQFNDQPAINNHHTPLKAFVSLLFGVLAIVFVFLIPNFTIGLIIGVIGLVFGMVGLKEMYSIEQDEGIGIWIGVSLNAVAVVIILLIHFF